MVKILVLGANGLLGSALVPQLRKLKFDVVTASQKINKNSDININYIDKNALENALDKCSPNIIINLVALTNVDQCERDPHTAYLVNVKVVENLCGWIKHNPDCHLIQISTDHLYDDNTLNTEDDVKLLNYYSLTKYAGELVALSIPSTIIRTNFFGKSICSNKFSFSDWIFNSLTNKTHITAFNDVYFSPISFKSLGESITTVIKNPLCGIYNIGSRDGFSKADFIKEFANQVNLSSDSVTIGSINTHNFIAKRPKDMRMDCGKFEAKFNTKLPNLKNEIMAIKGDYVHES